MDNYKEIASKPIFFERNRVYRVYKGGKLLGDFFNDSSVDGNYPEEWVASSVKALNKDSASGYEGISRVEGTEIYFRDLLEAEKEFLLGSRNDLGMLVKVLDSAIRLPAQTHPDKEFSRKYFNSNYGKAESWIVLGTRENAKIYFGFKDKITKEEFENAINQSETDKGAMSALLNEVNVKEGDIFFIPAKFIHAIGAGCLILEVQEPTDFTVQPEMWCDDYRLSEYEMYLGLSRDEALECFDFTAYGEEVIKQGKKEPKVIFESEKIKIEALITYNDTPCFCVNRYSVKDGEIKLSDAPSICIITKGCGTIEGDGFKREIKKGDYFFIPYYVRDKFIINSDDEIEFVECLPGI